MTGLYSFKSCIPRHNCLWMIVGTELVFVCLFVCLSQFRMNVLVENQNDFVSLVFMSFLYMLEVKN